MAIEQIDITSKEDLITVLQGLGYFDTIENNASTNQIECSIGSNVVLKIPSSTGTSASFEFIASNGASFSTTSKKMPTLVYKTRNGILATLGTNTTVSNYVGLILGKTNSNVVAACCCNAGTGTGVCKVGAVGETSPDISEQLYAAYGNWSTSPQITSIPIPTHPSNGVSYIKGAKAVICGPRLSTGITTINGVEYATNGYIMLSDEA